MSDQTATASGSNTGPKEEKYKGTFQFRGKVIPGSFESPGTFGKPHPKLEDERVQIRLEDGRVVGSRGEPAAKLREKLRCWMNNQPLIVTMHGMSNDIMDVALDTRVKGDDEGDDF